LLLVTRYSPQSRRPKAREHAANAAAERDRLKILADWDVRDVLECLLLRLDGAPLVRRRIILITGMTNDATKAPLVDTIKMADHDRDGKS
jgi:hypothetical protein